MIMRQRLQIMLVKFVHKKEYEEFTVAASTMVDTLRAHVEFKFELASVPVFLHSNRGARALLDGVTARAAGIGHGAVLSSSNLPPKIEGMSAAAQSDISTEPESLSDDDAMLTEQREAWAGLGWDRSPSRMR